MQQVEARVVLLVRDYDEIVSFYCSFLGFRLLFDADFTSDRHVVLQHGLVASLHLLIHRASSSEQVAVIGRQAGDHPLLVLPTNDCAADHERFTAAGLRLRGELIELPYGVQTTVADPLGNWICLSQNY